MDSALQGNLMTNSHIPLIYVQLYMKGNLCIIENGGMTGHWWYLFLTLIAIRRDFIFHLYKPQEHVPRKVVPLDIQGGRGLEDAVEAKRGASTPSR